MNQAVTFGVLAGGGILAIKALTGASFSDIAKGHAGTVSTTGQTIASNGVAGVGSAIASGAATATATSIKGAPAKVDVMLSAAKALAGRPYQWGGGHSVSDWLDAAAYDCSGYVSAILGHAGIISGPQTTQTLASQPGIASGAGKWVTIYDRTDAGGQDHVIMNIAGEWFESGGNTSFNPSGGTSQIAHPSASYLASFNTILHPVGL